MRQRVMIAIAIACGPKLLFADEPTTALDVTVQAQILDLLQTQQRERFMAMILVTHDLGVVAGRTDEIAVMYAGKIVEKAPTRTLFAEMRMPYTEALVHSIPKLADPSHTRLNVIPGRPPDLARSAEGLQLRPRCPYVQDKCREEEPPLPAGTGGRSRVRVLVPRRDARRSRRARAQPRRAAHAEPGPGGLGPDDRWDALVAGSGTAHLRDKEALLRVENLVVEFPAGRGSDRSTPSPT